MFDIKVEERKDLVETEESSNEKMYIEGTDRKWSGGGDISLCTLTIS